MKKIVFVLMVFMLSSCLSYKLVTFADNEFVKVYENLDASQGDLFLKTNEWMVSVFNNAKSVVQHSDKEEGVIIGKYLMHTIPTSNTGMFGTYDDIDIFAVIDIRVKDNRARLSIKPNDYSYPVMLPYNKEKAVEEMQRLEKSFAHAVRKERINF